MEGVCMRRKARIVAACLCAAQIAAMIPLSASAAGTEVSVDTIAVGENHSLVIKSDMSLWAAGDNTKGQLGIGNDTDRSNGTKVMDKAVFVEANDDVSFAIDENGTLYGWGDNSRGQVSPNSSSTYIYKPQKIRENVEEVCAGDTHTVALLQDGSVVGWGSNEYGELGFTANSKINSETKISANAADIAAGDGFTLIVTAAGEVYACGSNENGQLGTGNYKDQAALVKVVSGGVAEAEAGNDHSVLLMSDGTVKASGHNNCGQIGSDSGSAISSFQTVNVKRAKAVFAGGNSSGAVTSDGVLYTWGANESGQLHNENRDNTSNPERITSGAVSIALGEHHSLLLKSSGSISSAGSGVYGELFTEKNSIVPKPVLTLKNVIAYSAGTDHAAAINEDGVLYTWGCNDKGQLGLGDYTYRTIPTRVRLYDNAVNVWCGNKVTIVQTDDNSVYVFGDNSGYLLGMSTRSSTVNKPEYNEELSFSKIDKIVLRDNFAIALISGTVYGWGTNYAGRLTSCGRTVKYPETLDCPGGVSDIAAGNNHCFALIGGELYGWGGNSLKQLGITTDSRTVESAVLLEIKDRKNNPLRFTDIDAAGDHTIAVTSDGDIYAWGDNYNGQLGSDISRLREPTKVGYAGSIVASSSDFSAVINAMDSVSLSGNNLQGQLGDGTTKSSSEFKKDILENAVYISLGGNFAGCITDENRLYCWGDNTYGQVGNGSGGVKSEPETVISNGLCKPVAQPESITLDKTELSLKPKGVARITATIAPDNVFNKTVVWSSSNESVATVNDSGLVKAIKNGTAVITAKTSNGLTAKCNVTVATPVSSFSVYPSKSKTLNVNGTFTFTSKVFPAAADDKTLLFSSSDENVAYVDENGTVTAVAPGMATITVTAKTNPAKTRTVTIYVRPDKVKVTYRKATSEGVVLEWSESDNADGYVVYRRNTPKGTSKFIGKVTSDDPEDLRIVDKTAVKGNYYYYYVKSYVLIDGKRLYSSSPTLYKIKAK